MNRRTPALWRSSSSVLLLAGALVSCVLPELHKTEGSDGGAGVPDGSISAGGSTAGSGGDGSGGGTAGQGGSTGSGGRGGTGGSGTGGSGTGGSGTGGSGTGGSGTGGSATGGVGGIGGVGGSAGIGGMGGACFGGITQCTDCADNDGDALTDAEDPDCIGPVDQDEGSFPLGIPGENVDPCLKDCAFDDNGGSGDDGCSRNFECDPSRAGDTTCPYDPTAPCPVQTQMCRDVCLPNVPNGCDCFGCCEIPAAGSNFVYIGAPDCTFSNATDPVACPPCTQAGGCLNPLNPCELGIGDTTLSASCGGLQECLPGHDPCGLAGQDPCPEGTYCLTGCCIPIPP